MIINTRIKQDFIPTKICFYCLFNTKKNSSGSSKNYMMQNETKQRHHVPEFYLFDIPFKTKISAQQSQRGK